MMTDAQQQTFFEQFDAYLINDTPQLAIEYLKTQLDVGIDVFSYRHAQCGDTVLHRACRYAQPAVVCRILTHRNGLQLVNVRSAELLTPLELALDCNIDSEAGCKVVQLLLESGAVIGKRWRKYVQTHRAMTNMQVLLTHYVLHPQVNRMLVCCSRYPSRNPHSPFSAVPIEITRYICRLAGRAHRGGAMMPADSVADLNGLRQRLQRILTSPVQFHGCTLALDSWPTATDDDADNDDDEEQQQQPSSSSSSRCNLLQ